MDKRTREAMTISSNISCLWLKADLHGKRKSLVSFMMLSKILIIQQRPCSWISVAFLHLLPKITSDSKGISRNTKFCWIFYLRLNYRLISNKSCFLQLIEPYYFVILHGKSIDMTNERYIEKREKIAEDYWKKASVKELNYIKR